MIMVMMMMMVMIFSFDQKNCSYSCFRCLSLKLFYLHVALFVLIKNRFCIVKILKQVLRRKKKHIFMEISNS